MVFGDRLRDLRRRLPGAQALALVGRDGIVVEASPDGSGLDLEALTAELMAQVRIFTERQRELGAGRVEQFSILTDRYTILLSAVTEDYHLLAVLDGPGGYGRARFELRRARLLFGPDLV